MGIFLFYSLTFELLPIFSSGSLRLIAHLHIVFIRRPQSHFGSLLRRGSPCEANLLRPGLVTRVGRGGVLDF
jgi:hypothetical protein